MASFTFQQILANIAKKAITSNTLLKDAEKVVAKSEPSKSSLTWLLSQAKKIRESTLNMDSETKKNIPDASTLIAEAGQATTKEGQPIARLNQTLTAGTMILFTYDPKTKDNLPYYDTFPLVFPFELKNDGFLGLNMHYLPPHSRAVLMDSLYSTLNNNDMNENTKLQINYEMLKGANRFKEYKPCIKRYLNSHIRSPRLTIESNSWDMVLMLPLARFMKADQLKIWNDSLDKIRGIKNK